MTWVAHATAWLLAIVFVVAAVSKVRDLAAVEWQLDAMGIRQPRVAARVLPIGELAVAAVLVVVPWVGASLALATLAGFTLVLVRQLRSGSTVGCACFGAVSARPVSGRDVARNVLLMVVAIVVLSTA